MHATLTHGNADEQQIQKGVVEQILRGVKLVHVKPASN